MHVCDLPTPALLLDLETLQHNLDTMAARARSLGVALRPHIKTHKCVEIARMQRDRGAQGLTVATLVEAGIFAAAGFNDITYAFPLEPGKVDRALNLAERVTLRLTLDDLSTAEALETAAASRGQEVHVWIKVDCGYHRAGVDPTGDYAVQLARFLSGAAHLRFDGLLTHAGHAYHAASQEQLETIASQERDVLVRLADRLRADGTAVSMVSIGSTPTVSVVSNLESVQEIRPGSYVFYDRTLLVLGSCRLQDCALTVLASVVSNQPNSNWLVMDAGALALSLDPGPSHLEEKASKGAVVSETTPLAIRSSLLVGALSQEHGIIQGSSPEDLADLSVGSRVRILPNHSCLTAALFDRYAVVKGQEVLDHWEIRRSRS
ncbi:MAG: alanine racemase [Candidatus Neomarinimicrobiota bacterium]